MELKLIRETKTNDSTIGKLYVNELYHCYTLEDKEREVKVQNVTAIPKGRYEVIVNFSNRFQQQMPLLLNVPNFEGVRIHWGNYSKDTEGCILLGMSANRVKGMIFKSRDAVALFEKLTKKQPFTLNIL